MLDLRKTIISDLGVVDILVNNAAILPTNLSLREGKWTSLERILKVNIHSHFWVGIAVFYLLGCKFIFFCLSQFEFL